MLLPDVNVLVYAHRQDAPDHRRYLSWLEQVINGDEAYGMADLVLSGFLRVVTHHRVFSQPSAVGDALAFAGGLRDQPNCVPIAPGPRHWTLFVSLCQGGPVRPPAARQPPAAA